MTQSKPEILRLSAQIVAAHAQHNSVERGALVQAIHRVYNTLRTLSDGQLHPLVVSVEMGSHHAHVSEHIHHGHGGPDHNAFFHPEYGQTVFEDHLICMEDGLTMKMLKRHLLTVHGMTPDEYRAKWKLPANYPMVAPQYARLRSDLALESGLGLKRQDRPKRGRRKRGNG
jgi:predicted transcriptional regulator